jgi:hypothetical protein
LPEHLIGLLLGTEDDWPRAFEAIVERLPAIEYAGERHVFRTERIMNEPFDLRATPRYELVIDRLGWWYDLAREWVKKCALMNDVYLLNNPADYVSGLGGLYHDSRRALTKLLLLDGRWEW